MQATVASNGWILSTHNVCRFWHSFRYFFEVLMASSYVECRSFPETKLSPCCWVIVAGVVKPHNGLRCCGGRAPPHALHGWDLLLGKRIYTSQSTVNAGAVVVTNTHTHRRTRRGCCQAPQWFVLLWRACTASRSRRMGFAARQTYIH